MMGWKQVFFYPTSEASPYEPFDPESEMIWGQMQALSAIAQQGSTSPGVARVRGDAPAAEIAIP